MLSVLNPRQLFRAAIDLELMSARALEASAPTSHVRLHWTEHHNRLRAFGLFQFADVMLGMGPHVDLPELVAAAFEYEPFDRLWIIEGSGCWWGNREFGRSVPPWVPSSRLPAASLIPLHGGLGLAIATQLLRDSDGEAIHALLQLAVHCCGECSAPGFDRVALEATGLAVRTFRPDLARRLDEHLRREPELRRCFWHGVGRGTYFAPSNWMSTPGVAWQSIGALPGVGDDAAARRNAVRGFAWAVTLVNLGAPGVLERYARAMIDAYEIDELTCGVQSAIVAWRHAAPDDHAVIDSLLLHEPADSAAVLAWNRLVREPALRGIAIAPTVSSDRIADALYGDLR
jgi:hypothetical protein